MARRRGMAATRRGRTTAYAARLAVAATLMLASPAAAQGTGGASAGDPPSQQQLSAPPPGVVVRPAPRLRSWRCVRRCDAASGAVLRVRGQRLGRTYEVVFLGGLGEDDDIAAAPVKRTKKVVSVRVPLGAVTGPLLVRNRDDLQSEPSRVPVQVAGGPTTIEVQTRARRAYFDARRPATVSYVVHGDTAAHVLVELLRAGDDTVVESWDTGTVPPETRQTVTWNGTAAGHLQKEGRYTFRVSAVSASGAKAVSAQARRGTPDPATFQFLRHVFPVRGPHGYGEFAARFGGGRGHQGQDVFASCGTPLWAARGGKVKFKQYQSAAGYYLVIDGQRTGTDYAYMHMREPALVDAGDRVRTGQLLGYVGRTGDATACHLHFEMWTAPGWYHGGHPVDPLPSLLAWDKAS